MQPNRALVRARVAVGHTHQAVALERAAHLHVGRAPRAKKTLLP